MCGLFLYTPKCALSLLNVINYKYMSEELNQMENHDDTVPPQQTTSSDKKESVFAWIVILVVLLLIAGYFYYMFGMKGSVMDENQQNVTATNPQSSEPRELSNEEIDYSTPLDQVKVSGLNYDILPAAVTKDHGRIFVTPETFTTLYVHSDNTCSGECLNSWTPYSSETEINDGSIGSVYRDDIGAWQITWKGQGLYTFNIETRATRYSGNGVDGVWEFARP